MFLQAGLCIISHIVQVRVICPNSKNSDTQQYVNTNLQYNKLKVKFEFSKQINHLHRQGRGATSASSVAAKVFL